MHFWLSTARLYGRVPVPRKTSLNWFMPALVKSKVGSSSGTTLDDGTAVCPCFLTKKSRNCWRISLDVGMVECYPEGAGSQSRGSRSAPTVNTGRVVATPKGLHNRLAMQPLRGRSHYHFGPWVRCATHGFVM